MSSFDLLLPFSWSLTLFLPLSLSYVLPLLLCTLPGSLGTVSQPSAEADDKGSMARPPLKLVGGKTCNCVGGGGMCVCVRVCACACVCVCVCV